MNAISFGEHNDSEFSWLNIGSIAMPLIFYSYLFKANRKGFVNRMRIGIKHKWAGNTMFGCGHDSFSETRVVGAVSVKQNTSVVIAA